MKVTPVSGTPTIANPAATGLAPEKLARIRSIATGEAPIHVAEVPKPQPKPTEMQRITMKTKQTIHRNGEPSAQTGTEIHTDPNQPEIAIPDASGQTNATPEATGALSPQVVALQKQRRAFQQERQAFESGRNQFKAEAKAEAMKEIQSRLKANALSVLQEQGVTYDQLTNEILANQSNPAHGEIQELKADIAALREGVDKTLTDKDTQAEAAVIQEMRRNINRLSAEGDEFELVRETQSQADVVELIHRTWKKTGEVMDEQEAMRLIEDELTNDALRFAKTKKVQGKLTPAEPVQPHLTAPQGMRTLTNKDSAKPVLDRRQRAIAAALGQLKR